MTRQQRRDFERARDKEMQVLKDWAEKFFKMVLMCNSNKEKRTFYKSCDTMWKKYVLKTNRTNGKVKLSGKMFSQYMERFYLICAGKDASPEWKGYRKQLSQALPFKRKFLLWITDGKIVAAKK